MKRLLIILLLPLMLCGCEQKPRGYLITAIAVDYSGGYYTVWCEAVITNTEKADQKREVLTYKARTFPEAVKGVENQSTEPFILSHCGVVVVGKGITRTKLRGVMRYCKENRDITLSLQFLRCDEVEKMLDIEPISSISVGYDLVSFQKTQAPNEKNRLFEICENLNPILPKIKLTEKGYFIE